MELPDDVLGEILHHADNSSLRMTHRVSRNLRSIVEDEWALRKNKALDFFDRVILLLFVEQVLDYEWARNIMEIPRGDDIFRLGQELGIFVTPDRESLEINENKLYFLEYFTSPFNDVTIIISPDVDDADEATVTFRNREIRIYYDMTYFLNRIARRNHCDYFIKPEDLSLDSFDNDRVTLRITGAPYITP